MAEQTAAAPKPRPSWLKPLEHPLVVLGELSMFAGQSATSIFRRPYRVGLLMVQLEFMAYGSMFVVGLTGLFTGMVLALQTVYAFGLFNAQSLVGATVEISLARDLPEPHPDAGRREGHHQWPREGRGDRVRRDHDRVLPRLPGGGRRARRRHRHHAGGGGRPRRHLRHRLHLYGDLLERTSAAGWGSGRMSPPPAPQPVIDVQDLYKSFAGFPVLMGIDLKMMEGTTTVVLGASGSGKTVLMKHIMGLFKPDHGQVIVDGENVSTMNRQQLAVFRERMGMVFQSSALFDSMTVGDNVAFPLREHNPGLSEREIREKVKEKLAVVDLHDVEQKFPAELSGGMRKRVGLARAIVREPKIVLYDEPTTGLDPLTTESVDEVIIHARERLSVTRLGISHDIGSAFHIGDHIAVINEGRIVAEGTPAEVRKTKEPFTQQFLATWFGRT